MDIQQFYAEVGKLLYAVADIDGMITKQERDELHNLIQTRLMHRETHTDEYGTNDAWYTEFEFDVAEEQGMNPMEAFESFSDFIHTHQKAMDSTLKDICLLLADRLAESYHHTNRKEKVIIQKLKETLYILQPVNH